MKDDAISIQLREAATGKLVDASILREISQNGFRVAAEPWNAAKAFFRAQSTWRSSDIPENDSSDWQDKAATAPGDLHQLVGVATDEIQGMMMVALVPQPSRKLGREDQPVLYIEYLDIAPWNLPEYAGEHARYRRVGISLLAVAVEMGVVLGCERRLALRSLPNSRLFYEQVGFERIGFDESENLDWFELSGVTMGEGVSNGPAQSYRGRVAHA
jgi:hypothetical protein